MSSAVLTVSDDMARFSGGAYQKPSHKDDPLHRDAQPRGREATIKFVKPWTKPGFQGFRGASDVVLSVVYHRLLSRPHPMHADFFVARDRPLVRFDAYSL